MAIRVGTLVKDREYKVKYEGEARAATRTYTGDRHQGDYDFEAVGSVALFEGRGGIKFYPYSGIISAVEVDPTKQEARKSRVCPRCLGNKRFEHLSHVQGGTCFQCGGTGTI